MNNIDKDLENINSIDMSVNPAALDDDDSFGSITVMDTDDRNFQSKTGIIIDLSDDDDIPKKITANIDLNSPNIAIKSDFEMIDSDPESYNMIDMETEYFDDEDESLVSQHTDIHKDLEVNDNLVFENDEPLIQESITDGTVDKDYWKDISAKHRKSNKRGAYNTHFHLSGNPKADMEFFNQAMGGNTAEFSETNISAKSILSNVTGIAAATSGDAAVNINSGEASGFGESLKKDTLNTHTKDLKDLLNIINIEIILNSDESFTVLDLCDDSIEYTCSNIDELRYTLQPYIEDFFIYPLQIHTGEKLNTCQDWCNWYQIDANRAAYPKCANDIKYCDLIANHLSECAFEELI